ncbi:hypothetical protein [Acinetobacter sp. ANC 3882]|uniref:hypothetical protein n=1 Tax=Acinetobacter sp. ANC 3882 TaxID=2923423 RepID=UPI001F4AA381|nr:hypothetical protein [Acinetobacter sp. ANC 3882]MCH7314210.1 hypothetical protein [Acinetobacter sp. ANC 3882]
MQQQSQHLASFKVHELVLSLSPLQLNQHLVIQIEKSLGLSFNEQDQPHRVCFANQNAELQDAYKQVFTALDLLDYVYAVLAAEKGKIDLLDPKQHPIPYPTDNLQFWTLVKIGQHYRSSLA